MKLTINVATTMLQTIHPTATFKCTGFFFCSFVFLTENSYQTEKKWWVIYQLVWHILSNMSHPGNIILCNRCNIDHSIFIENICSSIHSLVSKNNNTALKSILVYISFHLVFHIYPTG